MQNLLFQYRGIDILSFAKTFPTEVQCKVYLSQYKWKDGFTCPKCGHQKHWKGRDQFSRSCANCRHLDSCTANTLFHKVKFGLVKAFMIVHEMSTTTKSISERAMGRKYDITKDTAWLFMHKVRAAMSSQNEVLTGKVECSLSSKISQLKKREEDSKQAQNKTKNIRIVAAVQCQGRGISLQKAWVKLADQKMKEILHKEIDENADIMTNNLSIRQLTEIDPIETEKEKPQLKRVERFTNGLINWIKGIHHAIGRKYCQHYLDEYCYRLNHHRQKDLLFDLTVQAMVAHPPRFYHKT